MFFGEKLYLYAEGFYFPKKKRKENELGYGIPFGKNYVYNDRQTAIIIRCTRTTLFRVECFFPSSLKYLPLCRIRFKPPRSFLVSRVCMRYA